MVYSVAALVNTGILHYVQDDDFTRMANGSREYA